ncbi:MAG: negative regulator of flagellin synthesis FlgM [Halieaceae bacterium]|jgi:negative regulator of flagellin synthesis FlgM
MKPVNNTMDIKPTRTDLDQVAQRTTQAVEAPGGKSASAAGATTTDRDTVTLTNFMAEMQKLEVNLAALPDVDSSKVAAIKASLAEGTYEVDMDKLVDKLLSSDRDLG